MQFPRFRHGRNSHGLDGRSKALALRATVAVELDAGGGADVDTLLKQKLPETGADAPAGTCTPLLQSGHVPPALKTPFAGAKSPVVAMKHVCGAGDVGVGIVRRAHNISNCSCITSLPESETVTVPLLIPALPSSWLSNGNSNLSS